jgi:hypothetical protein
VKIFLPFYSTQRFITLFTTACRCSLSWARWIKSIYFNIVTCQPIVGLRNKALLGSRPLSASRPSTRCATVGEAGWRHATALKYGSCATGRDDVTLQHARFRGNVVQTQWPDATQLSPCSLLQLRLYDWGFIRGTEMSKQSLFMKQFSRGVRKEQSYDRVVK